MNAPLSTPFAGLNDPRIAATLDRLHRKSRGDAFVFLRALPAAGFAALRRRPVMKAVQPYLKDAYIPVTRDQGRMLYLLARAIGARTIVEFGTSFGISAIYLAAAAKANGGRFIGTELEATKVSAARQNIADAGLTSVAEVCEGDALETLWNVEPPIDFVLLDGWKDLYIDIAELLRPKLRPGALVLADNIFTFKKTLRPFVTGMQAPGSGFESATLAIGHGMELSVKI